MAAAYGSKRHGRFSPYSLILIIPSIYVLHITFRAIYSPSSSLTRPGYAHFEPPNELNRGNDLIDTFAGYRYARECEIQSTKLHMPFEPVCADKQAVLDAMSSGGRVGFDEPYIPLGCDMRWYSTEQVCDILDQFSQVIVIGDSLQRHIVNALYTILRSDIGLGGITDWNPPIDGVNYKTVEDCLCQKQITTKDCSESAIWNSDWIAGNNSRPMCAGRNFNTHITYRRLLQWPLGKEDLESVSSLMPLQRPDKPPVFIINHMYWNDVNLTETTWFLEELFAHMKQNVPYLNQDFHRLYVAANAGGMAKGFGLLATQGNDKLANFELAVTPVVQRMGMDMLGMFNMSVQSTQWDGAHATLEQNLLKVQMIANWLDQVRRNF